MDIVKLNFCKCGSSISRRSGVLLLEVLLVSALMGITSPTGAEDWETGNSSSEEYSTKARAGTIVGTSLEVVGLLGAAIGLVISYSGVNSEEAAPRVMLISGGTFLAGNFVSTTAYTVRHRAYRDAGLSPRVPMAVTSWISTASMFGFYMGTVGSKIRWNKEKRFEDGMGMVIYFTVAMSLEVVDLVIFRPLWKRSMRDSESDDTPRISLVPFVAPAQRGRVGSRILGLAATASF